MKRIAGLTLLLLSITCFTGYTAIGQNESLNGYASYEEFISDQASVKLDFELKERTSGDIFMMGGIANFRLKKIEPKYLTTKAEEYFWGVRKGGIDYINSYPYSKIKGYNQIIGKGYYSYFIGEPARTLKEQRDLGIIKPTEKLMVVCCKAGYVLLPDGQVKLLRPELLMELCKDNPALIDEIKNEHLRLEDVEKMFGFLKSIMQLKANDRDSKTKMVSKHI